MKTFTPDGRYNTPQLMRLREQGKLWAKFAAAAISSNHTGYSNISLALEVADRALAEHNNRFDTKEG